MKLKPKITIADHFLGIEDPRIDRTKRHKLIDILTIAICAVICGADSWVTIELYGCTKANASCQQDSLILNKLNVSRINPYLLTKS